jgi:class 3 adenylate cyclase
VLLIQQGQSLRSIAGRSPTGEIDRRGDRLARIGVHTGSRILSLAKPGEVLVSRTVRDLVAGSGLTFVDRGMHALKGIPDEWRESKYSVPALTCPYRDDKR